MFWNEMVANPSKFHDSKCKKIKNAITKRFFIPLEPETLQNDEKMRYEKEKQLKLKKLKIDDFGAKLLNFATDANPEGTKKHVKTKISHSN